MSDLFDVIEVEFQKPHRVRIIDRNKTAKNAEAVVSMAVMRRGVGEHFFETCAAGKYQDGDPLEMRP